MISRLLDPRIETWIAQRHIERRPGIHVSTALVAYLKTLDPKNFGHYGASKKHQVAEPMFEMGYIWEDLMGEVLTPRLLLQDGETLVASQLEVEKDGVIGTPDRIIADAEGFIVEDTKITWKWITPDIEDPKFRYWVCQVMLYAEMIGAQRARIRALFINELQHSREFVVPGAWELDWRETPHELSDFWRSFSRFAQTLRAA